MTFSTVLFLRNLRLAVPLVLLAFVASAQSGARAKADSLNQLAFSLAQQEPDSALGLVRQALVLAAKAKYKPGFSKGYINAGIAHQTQGRYDSAKHYYKLAQQVRVEMRDSAGIASVLNNMGALAYVSGNYAEALDHYLVSLEIRERLQDSAGIAASLTNLGNLYQKNNNFQEAERYYQTALAYQRKARNLPAVAGLLNNLAITYDLLRRPNQALVTYKEALQLRERLHDVPGLGAIYNNIGEIYKAQRDYGQARQYYSRSLQIKRELGDNQGIAMLLNNLGTVARLQGDSRNALALQQQSLLFARASNSLEEEGKALNELAQLHQGKGDYKSAVAYLQAYEKVRDTLTRMHNMETVALLRARMQLQERENTIRQLAQEKTINDLTVSQQNAQLGQRQLIIWFLVVAGSLLAGFAVVVVRTNRSQRELNRELQLSSAQISAQRDELEAINRVINDRNELLGQKNREITDSLNYARRIQFAIQPEEKQLRDFFPDYFVFNRPRDIVSGDFYWFHRLNNDQALVAVGDCVGHGVPGAFMTVLTTQLLNEVVVELGHHGLGDIMVELHQRLTEAMHRGGTAYDTGGQLDLALVAVDRRDRQAQVLSAKMQVVAIADGESNVFPAARFSVGTAAFQDDALAVQATTLPPGTWFYAMSDGYADQFGGEAGKKYLTKNLRQTLTTLSSQPGQSQSEALALDFDQWRKGQAQTDDVLIFGFRL